MTNYCTKEFKHITWLFIMHKCAFIYYSKLQLSLDRLFINVNTIIIQIKL